MAAMYSSIDFSEVYLMYSNTEESWDRTPPTEKPNIEQHDINLPFFKTYVTPNQIGCILDKSLVKSSNLYQFALSKTGSTVSTG
jgi:hypothetical protein